MGTPQGRPRGGERDGGLGDTAGTRGVAVSGDPITKPRRKVGVWGGGHGVALSDDPRAKPHRRVGWGTCGGNER